jgi:hypothetical protein
LLKATPVAALLCAFYKKSGDDSNLRASIIPMHPSSVEKAILTELLGSQVADSISESNLSF